MGELIWYGWCDSTSATTLTTANTWGSWNDDTSTSLYLRVANATRLIA